MSRHSDKHAAVKASLTAKLHARTQSAIFKHGLISQADIDRMKAEQEARLKAREARRAVKV